MLLSKSTYITIALLGLSTVSGCGMTSQRDTYQISETEVNWVTSGSLTNKLVYKELPGANPATFRILNKQFGTDGEYVYYKGAPIPLADANTFRALSNNYGVDHRFAFLRNKVLEGASPEGFKVIHDDLISSYAKNGKSAYYNQTPFTICDEKSFRIIDGAGLGRYWAADNTCAYSRGKVFIPADIESFEELSFSYAKDSQNVYYENTVIEGADSATFELLYRNNIIDSKDKSGCYIDNHRVPCNTTKNDDSIFSGVNFDTIGTKEGKKEAFNTIQSNMNAAKKTRQEIATQNAEVVRQAVVSKLGNNLLTPNSKLDLQQITNDYYFTLVPTLSGYSLTYQVKTIDRDGMTLDMFSRKVNEVMKSTYNNSGQLTSETRPLGRSGYVTKYIGVKCERQLGICEEEFISGSKKSTDKRSVKISYKNGVWERSFLINGRHKQEYRIYDQYGFEVYVAKYSNDELDSEFIRKSFRPDIK